MERSWEVLGTLVEGRFRNRRKPLNPTEVKTILYLLYHGYVAPNYMPPEEWLTLAKILEINPGWLWRIRTKLLEHNILRRQRPSRSANYGLNPDWRPPQPREPVP